MCSQFHEFLKCRVVNALWTHPLATDANGECQFGTRPFSRTRHAGGCATGFVCRLRRAKMGSSTNEVRGEICVLNLLALIDDLSAASEHEP